MLSFIVSFLKKKKQGSGIRTVVIDSGTGALKGSVSIQAASWELHWSGLRELSPVASKTNRQAFFRNGRESH